jgi:hypothetical protein
MKKFWISAVTISGLALAVMSASSAGAAIKPPAPMVLERMNSVYNGELVVLDYDGGRYLLAKSRVGIVLHSAMDLKHKEQLKLGYLQIMALLTGLHPEPSHVYDLGLGGGELIRFQLHQSSKNLIDSAEIDPNVILIAKKYFDVQNPRHHILEGEGFDLLKRQSTKYDIIWVDDILSKKGPKAFVNSAQLDVLRGRLNDRGVLVANLGEARESKYFSEVERDYQRGYSHGIRIKSPVSEQSRTLAKLSAIAFPGNGKLVPALLPTYLLAVGNDSDLTCARFWDLYRKWTLEKRITVRWGSASPDSRLRNEICQELPLK